MGRFLLTALAVITAVIGLLMENELLLYAAGAFFLVALLMLAVLAAKRRRRRAGTPRGSAAPPAPTSREEELRALGLSEVRPRTTSTRAASDEAPPPRRPEPMNQPRMAAADGPEATADPEGAGAPPQPPPVEALAPDEPEEMMAGGAAADPEAEPLSERPHAPRDETPRDETPPMLHAADEHPFWNAHSPTAVASFLRALWAATEVQTALLATAEEDGTYTLLDVRSHLPTARKEGRFPADSFLRVAHPGRPITVLTEKDPLVRDLPYYRTAPPHAGEVAVLPVSGREGDTLFLVADLAGDQPAFTERQRALLLGFADLLRTMLAHPPEEAAARAVPTRRAVIAEEMSRARGDDAPLALALVYPTGAEAVSARGEAAVAEAERTLRLLLEDLVHHGRLEPFGELMFGAFLHDDVPTLERWAERVQVRAEEDGLPVAIGIVRLGEHHRDADALRADAANALAEALAGEERFALVEPEA